MSGQSSRAVGWFVTVGAYLVTTVRAAFPPTVATGHRDRHRHVRRGTVERAHPRTGRVATSRSRISVAELRGTPEMPPARERRTTSKAPAAPSLRLHFALTKPSRCANNGERVGHGSSPAWQWRPMPVDSAHFVATAHPIAARGVPLGPVSRRSTGHFDGISTNIDWVEDATVSCVFDRARRGIRAAPDCIAKESR